MLYIALDARSSWDSTYDNDSWSLGIQVDGVRGVDGVGVNEYGPSTAFTLGEVYVYPNPAKGGDAPIFHIECGLADSVDIKVYTVSGREAHEATLAAMPAIIDQRYAYEYVWRGHIPSGVYLYFIEARKGGQKIKKTGKFAVIR